MEYLSTKEISRVGVYIEHFEHCHTFEIHFSPAYRKVFSLTFIVYYFTKQSYTPTNTEGFCIIYPWMILYHLIIGFCLKQLQIFDWRTTYLLYILLLGVHQYSKAFQPPKNKLAHCTSYWHSPAGQNRAMPVDRSCARSVFRCRDAAGRCAGRRRRVGLILKKWINCVLNFSRFFYFQ